jgi:hypothetical protein
MPWLEATPMEQRERFIRDHAGGLYTMTELCARHSISRKTGYKWLERFDEGGRAALGDRSRAPLHCPHRMAGDMADLICSARRQHPSWGPEKLLQWLAPDLERGVRQGNRSRPRENPFRLWDRIVLQSPKLGTQWFIWLGRPPYLGGWRHRARNVERFRGASACPTRSARNNICTLPNLFDAKSPGLWLAPATASGASRSSCFVKPPRLPVKVSAVQR